MPQQVGDRDDIVGLSNEGPAVVVGRETVDAATVETPSEAQFHLGRNGTELIAVTDPRGRWVRWMPQR